MKERLDEYRRLANEFAKLSDPHSINYSLKKDELIQMQFNLEWSISQIGNDELGDLLLRRYIERRTLESIAEELDVDVRTVSRRLAAALALLERSHG